MIKNDRQYRVTKSQLRAFQSSIQALERDERAKSIPRELVTAEIEALRSQTEELQTSVDEYEALQRGESFHFVAENFDELPKLLIMARIASGLTQKELAERLDLREQQVQRWEANDYSGASIDTFKQVLKALNVEAREELFIPHEALTARHLLKRLISAGLSKELILKRLLPASLAVPIEDGKSAASLRDILAAASAVSRVFGASISAILDPGQPSLSFAPVGGPRFKHVSRASIPILNAYAVYASYLAMLVEACAPASKYKALPNDFHEVHHALTRPNDPMSFLKALNFVWDHGIVVLPLRDEGAFHGAVWKIRDRFVIVLKQKTALESRWLYDLLHECGHIVHGHVGNGEALIEDEPISPEVHSDLEDEANEWAEDAIFDGDSSIIEQACVRACGGKTQRLAKALPNVAREFNVNLGALANHMAFRLPQQNWWGAAHNLQTSSDPFEAARTVLLQRINVKGLNRLDRELLIRALMEE